MLNGAGRRNQRLGESDLLPHMGVNEFNHALEYRTHDIDFRIWIAEITRFAMERSNVNWILSLGLESNYSPLAAMNLLRLVVDEWPYETAYNPIDPDDCNYMPEWVLCETHTTLAPVVRPGRCIRSMDGEDSRDRSTITAFMEESEKAGCITFLWSAETQGTDVPWVPTLERTFRFNDVGFFKEILSEGRN